MATTLGGLHYVADFKGEIEQFLIRVEESGKIKTVPYFDSVGIATIGIGFNIDDQDAASRYLQYVLQEMDIDGRPSEIDPTKTANKLIADAIDSVTDGKDTTLQQTLNDTLRKHFKNFLGANATFSITDTQAKNVLHKILADKAPKLDAWLTEYNIDVASLKGTKEYMALTSLFYNREIVAKRDSAGNIIRDAQGRRIPTSNSLIGPKLLAALEYDNRAEAWFEIRYNSNSGSSKSSGVANRRYNESYLFGLYDTGATFTDPAEAKEVMRMYTKHQAEILAYEQKYSPSSAGFVGIKDNLKPAADYLIAQFGKDVTINGDVIVGAGLSSYSYLKENPNDDILLGTTLNDLIFGEKGDDGIVGMDGDDVIYAGEGHDTIIGGKGNDILEGGAGDDDYYFQSGDGSDKINDNEGANRIIWTDANNRPHVMKTFYKSGDAEWTSPDGTAEVNKNSPYKIVLPDGGIIELGEDISSFGINLLDTPADPTTTNTIIGDQNPDNPNDNLSDTSLNDWIEGQEGNDTISAFGGGDDVLLGGDGRDAISAGAGDDTAEGNAGADILMGGLGDDRIFGENKGEMEDIIAQGEVAENINEKGNLESGAGGNDLIYGSNKKDALFGEIRKRQFFEQEVFACVGN